MKDFVSKLKFTVSGSVLWETRNNFETERLIALEDNRHIALESERRDMDAHGNEVIERVISQQFSADALPSAIKSALPPGSLVSRTTSVWYPSAFDELHPSKFSTTMDALGDKVSIKGTQWIAKDGSDGCTMCTKTKISVNVPFVGWKIEGIICERMEASSKSYADRIARHATRTSSQANCSITETPTHCDASTSTSDLPALEMQRPEPSYVFAFPLLSMFTNVFVDFRGARGTPITSTDADVQDQQPANSTCACLPVSASRACRALKRRLLACRQASSSTRDTEIAMQLVEQSQRAQVSRQCAELGIVD